MGDPGIIVQHEPLKIAEHTWALPQLQGDARDPMSIYVNSLVIKAREPIIVDTGAEIDDRWLEAAWSIVDPEDVRWIFISHDDHDHTGNLARAMAAAPNATIVTNWFAVERLKPFIEHPMERVRFVDHGESFEAGDRTMVAIRPPLYDSPTTRGLLDTRTGMYWASDCFASPITGPAESVADLDREFWHEMLVTANSWLSPWHTLLDDAKFQRVVDDVSSYDIRSIASAHSPLIPAGLVSEAFGLLRTMPSRDLIPWPDQAALEAMFNDTLGAA